MPHLEAPVESRVSPRGDPLAALLPWLELREDVRKVVQIADLHSTLGMPRCWAPEKAARWLAGPHVRFQFADPQDLDEPAFAFLPVDQATAVVDLCLGGSGRPGPACAAGGPSDAECGVLAYLAARCVRNCAPTLQLCDVHAEARPSQAPWPSAALFWPLRVQLTPQLALDLKLIFSNRSALARRVLQARVALTDELAAAPAELTPGDLFVFEDWPGCFTHQGISGRVELDIAPLGLSHPFALEGGALRAYDTPPERARGRARLWLGESTLSVAELAQLVGGERVWPFEVQTRCELEQEGRVLALGTLVRYCGALALEVGSVPSIR